MADMRVSVDLKIDSQFIASPLSVFILKREELTKIFSRVIDRDDTIETISDYLRGEYAFLMIQLQTRGIFNPGKFTIGVTYALNVKETNVRGVHIWFTVVWLHYLGGVTCNGTEP